LNVLSEKELKEPTSIDNRLDFQLLSLARRNVAVFHSSQREPSRSEAADGTVTKSGIRRIFSRHPDSARAKEKEKGKRKWNSLGD